MVKIPLVILAILYGIAGMVYLFMAIRRICRDNEIRLIHCVRLMYAFLYGIVPFIIFLWEAQGKRKQDYYNYNTQGLILLFFLFIISVFVYVMILIFYDHAYHNARRPAVIAMPQYNRKNEARRVFACGIIMLIVGWISLLLWTRAYGSLGSFILNANAIRAGRGKIYNPLAFMKSFAIVIRLSLYALLSAYLLRKPQKLEKLIYLGAISLAAIGTAMYLLASDSRIVIAYVALAVVLLLLRYRRKKNIGRYLLVSALVLGAALLLTVFADSFTRYYRFGIWEINTKEILENIIFEFRFVYSAQACAANNVLLNGRGFKFFDDFVVAISSWFPDRFVPFDIPDTVWKYNTLLIAGANSSGTLPTDIIATSIYYFDIFGLFLWPAFLGLTLGYVDRKLKNMEQYQTTDVYYMFLSGLCVQQVSHSQLSSAVAALFPLFLYFLVNWSLKNVTIKKQG